MLLVTMIGGLASTIFIPLATLLVEVMTWRDTLRILALISAAVTVPLHALVLRWRPQALTQNLEEGGFTSEPRVSIGLRHALRAPTFWWLACAFALDRAAIVAVAAHGVPLLSERGYSPALVAAAVGSIGLMQVAGRFLFTPLITRFSLRTLSAFTFGVHALALMTLLTTTGAWSIWLFAALFGVANGSSTLARAALIAEVYGAAHYGSINGSMAAVMALAQTAAPLGAGVLFDLTGSYTPLLWVLVFSTLLAAALVTRAQVGELSRSNQEG